MHCGHATGWLWGFQIHASTKMTPNNTTMPAIMYIGPNSFFRAGNTIFRIGQQQKMSDVKAFEWWVIEGR